jgi:hypothetical protein
MSLTIHLYALCWNEADMLPYFFRHYDPIVTAYFIYDDGSTDHSVELLNAHPKTTVQSITVRKNLAPPGPDNPGISFFEFYNTIWKQSIGKADYVILCNIDEFFYHPDMQSYLHDCRNKDITIIPSVGYHMFSLTFPTAPLPLPQLVNKGIQHDHFNKTFLFDPNKITESGFHGGRHKMDPEGEVVYPTTTDVKLLHYFFIGLWRELKGKRQKGRRLKDFHPLYAKNNQSFLRQLRNCYRLNKNAKKVI